MQEDLLPTLTAEVQTFPTLNRENWGFSLPNGREDAGQRKILGIQRGPTPPWIPAAKSSEALENICLNEAQRRQIAPPCQRLLSLSLSPEQQKDEDFAVLSHRKAERREIIMGRKGKSYLLVNKIVDLAEPSKWHPGNSIRQRYCSFCYDRQGSESCSVVMTE